MPRMNRIGVATNWNIGLDYHFAHMKLTKMNRTNAQRSKQSKECTVEVTKELYVDRQKCWRDTLILSSSVSCNQT